MSLRLTKLWDGHPCPRLSNSKFCAGNGTGHELIETHVHLSDVPGDGIRVPARVVGDNLKGDAGFHQGHGCGDPKEARRKFLLACVHNVELIWVGGVDSSAVEGLNFWAGEVLEVASVRGAENTNRLGCFHAEILSFIKCAEGGQD